MPPTRRKPPGNQSLKNVLSEVWLQVLVENAPFVSLGRKKFPVRKTPKLGLLEVEFSVGQLQLVGLEQNPKTSSRWGKLARAGHKVMQFVEAGRYIAAVADGKAVIFRPNASGYRSRRSR